MSCEQADRDEDNRPFPSSKQQNGNDYTVELQINLSKS